MVDTGNPERHAGGFRLAELVEGILHRGAIAPAPFVGSEDVTDMDKPGPHLPYVDSAEVNDRFIPNEATGGLLDLIGCQRC